MKTELARRQTRDAACLTLLDAGNSEQRLLTEMIAARLRMGWTQAQLAQRLGTTQSTVARLECGGRSPSIKTLRRLAEVTYSRLVVRLDDIRD